MSGVDDNDERAQRLLLLGEIAGEAAHELRNALAVIRASAELLRSKDAHQIETHTAKIERNARLAQELIDTLMSLARGEPIHAAPVSLAAVLAEARRDVAAAAAYVDDFDPQLRVRASNVLLSRMFRVLYENAAQATAPRAPNITTRARLLAGASGAREDETLVIEVTDDGPGVPEAIRPSLFQPLVSQRLGGTGLGLALAARAARAHGGQIDLVPTERGASFRITLPRHRRAPFSAG